VPFADCLNHGNVATKYDYDVDNNGVFRLFPTAENHYPAGAEVFNSYGRRPNNNLLLDYGFALKDNEWDFFDLDNHLPPYDTLSTEHKTALYRSGSSFHRHTLLPKCLCWELLTYFRIVNLTPRQVSKGMKLG